MALALPSLTLQVFNLPAAPLWTGTAVVTSFLVLETHFGHLLTWLECLVSAVPLGFATAAWLAYLFASLRFHTLDVRCVQWAWALQALLGALYLLPACRRRCCGQRRKSAHLSARLRQQWPSVAAIALLSAAVTWPMVTSRFLVEREDGLYSGGTTWADLTFHLGNVASLLFGNNRRFGYDRLECTFMAGHRFAYPFLPDFHIGALLVADAEWRPAFLWPTFLQIVAANCLLFVVNLRLTGSVAAALLSVPLVVCSGGTAPFEWMWQRGWASAFRIEWNADPIEENNNQDDRSIYWFGYWAHLMLPQRSSTYALPLSLVVLLLLAAASEQRPDSLAAMADAAALLRAAAVIIGMLPLLQAHAFLALALVAGVLFLTDRQRWRQSRTLLWRGWMCAMYLGLAPSLVQLPVFVRRVLDRSRRQRFLWFTARSVAAEKGDGFWVAWFRALSFQLPIYMIVLVLLACGWCAAGAADKPAATEPTGIRQRLRMLVLSIGRFAHRELPAYGDASGAWRRGFLLPHAAVFVVGNWVVLQPWHKDNIKLLYYWLLQAAGVVAYALVRLFRRGGIFGKALAPLLVFSMVFAGVLSARREFGHINFLVYGHRDAVVADWIRQETRPDSVFLSGDDEYTASHIGAGRTMYICHLSWAWSHGYPDYDERQAFVRYLLHGEERNGTEMATALPDRRISHILVEPSEEQTPLEELFSEDDVRLVLEHEGYRVYAVSAVSLLDRPVEKISREALYLSSGLSLLCLYYALLCRWRVETAAKEAEEGGRGREGRESNRTRTRK